MEQTDLSALFLECLTASYRNVENSGSYAVCWQDGHLKLFFEKSSGRVDWRNNLDFPVRARREQGEGWLCHRGFLRVWRSLEPYLTPLICRCSVKRITVVGYSHGAALAALCHEYIWLRRPDLRDRLTGYGYGCPRFYWGFVLPGRLKRRWDTFYLVRNGCDLVTHLPPVLFGFRHVGHILRIGRLTAAGPIRAHRPERYWNTLCGGNPVKFSSEILDRAAFSGYNTHVNTGE